MRRTGSLKKTPLKRGSKSLKKGVFNREIEPADVLAMKLFFHRIWKSRPHYSEVSGEFLGNEPLTTFFHHILPKSKYKQAAFDPDNIILLTFDEHQNVELNPNRYEIINQRKEKLKEKYVTT